MDSYTDDKKTELDTYTGVKKTELDTYEGTKEAELNTYASGLKDAFDTNATSKTNAFNTNATSKTTDFDNNASTKTSAFDDNATAKTTAFDENAEEKTGDFNDNVDTKTAEFDAHVVEKETEFNENVDSIQGQITDIQEFIDSELEQGITEKGTRADVSDSAKWYGELAPEGRTEQKQLSGKNLFDANAEAEKGSTVYKYEFYAKPNTQYTTSTNCPQSNTANIYVNSNTSSSKAYIGSPKTITSDENGYFYISVRYKAVSEDSATFNLYDAVKNGEYWIQVEEGSTATDYEEYVGGTASPNPDFPQEIRNVEGRSTTNLVKVTTDNSLKSNTGGYGNYSINDATHEVISTGKTLMGFKVKVEPSTQYSIQYLLKDTDDTIIKNMRVREYSAEPIASTDWSGESFITQSVNESVNVGYKTKTFTTQENTQWILFVFYSNGGNTTVAEWQVNKGSILLPYEEYFGGKRLELNVCNKNLWQDMGDIEKEISSTLSAKRINNVYFLNGIFGDSAVSDKVISLTRLETANYSSYLNVLPGNGMLLEPGTYTCTMKNFKGIISGTDWNSFKAIKVGTTTSERITIASVTLSSSKSMTFTLTEPTEIYLSIMYQKTTEFNNVSFEIQLEKNNIETEFIKSAQQLIPFPLQDGQKLMEGDYLAEDGVHHVRGQVALDGSESISGNPAISGHHAYVVNLNNRKLRGKTLSNCFMVYTVEYINNSIFNGLALNIIKDDITELSSFKSWLAERYANGTPVIIEYELAEETIDPYTEAQAEAYSRLKKLMLNQGVNHIWAETDGVEPNLQLTYYKSNKERLNNIEARLELLEN